MATCLYEIKVYFLDKENIQISKSFQRNLNEESSIDDINELYLIEIHPEIKSLYPDYIIEKIEVSKIFGIENKLIGTLNIDEKINILDIPPSATIFQEMSILFSKLENVTKEQKELVISIFTKIRENNNVKIILDTNIFLKSSKFVEMLMKLTEKLNIKIYIISDTFDEICRIKDKNEYNTILAKNARLSLRIIESMIKEKKMIIEGDIERQIRINAYADPKIIKWIENNINNDFIIAIINDTELRIRLREKTKKLENNIWIIHKKMLSKRLPKKELAAMNHKKF